MIDVSENTIKTCNSTECEAHRYMMEQIHEIKEGMKVRDAECIDIKTNVIILTQSHNRLGEILEELKEGKREQDDKIEKNSKVTNKVAFFGGLLVISIPVILWMLENLQFIPKP